MGLLMVNFAIIVLILIFSGISERPHFSNSEAPSIPNEGLNN